MIDIAFGSLLHYFVATSSVQPSVVSPVVNEKVLSRHSFSLGVRYDNEFVNAVFKDNILLTLAYMKGTMASGSAVNWEEIHKPFHYEFTLNSGDTISYHHTVKPEYENKAKPLVHVYFSGLEGFKSDGYLTGDGTCHLASLLSWTAKDAGLFVDAPTNHDFASIPEVPKEQGVSIYNHPNMKEKSTRENLYIQNIKDHPVVITFDYIGDELILQAVDKTTY